MDTVKLTERTLRRIVKESVERIIKEVSTDTMDSATEKSKIKYKKAFDKYGKFDPRTIRSKEQHSAFKDAWDNEYSKGNNARKARMLTNREKRQNKERSYVDGKGWRNTEDKSSCEERPYHADEPLDINNEPQDKIDLDKHRIATQEDYIRKLKRMIPMESILYQNWQKSIGTPNETLFRDRYEEYYQRHEDAILALQQAEHDLDRMKKEHISIKDLEQRREIY